MAAKCLFRILNKFICFHTGHRKRKIERLSPEWRPSAFSKYSIKDTGRATHFVFFLNTTCWYVSTNVMFLWPILLKCVHILLILWSTLLLASTGALIVMMVYYIYIRSRPLFQIFTQSIDAIDVTSVTLSCLNSINAVDVTRCWLNVEYSNFPITQCSSVSMFQYSNVPMV